MMNRQRRIAATAAIVFTLLSAGCLFFESSDELEVSLSADQDTYSFGEAMLIQVMVNTSRSMDNVTVRGEGLVSSKGPQLTLGPRTVELLSGTNIVNFSTRVPSCSPCTKLTPGSYNITASVSQGDDLIAEVSCTVELVK